MVDVDHRRVRRAGLAVATAEEGTARAGKEEGWRWNAVGPRREGELEMWEERERERERDRRSLRRDGKEKKRRKRQKII